MSFLFRRTSGTPSDKAEGSETGGTSSSSSSTTYTVSSSSASSGEPVNIGGDMESSGARSGSTTYSMSSSSASSGEPVSIGGGKESSGTRSGSTTYSISSSSASTGEPDMKSFTLSGGKESSEARSGSTTYSMSSSSASIDEPGIKSVTVSGEKSSSEARSGSVSADGSASFQMLGEMMASSAGEADSGVSENGSSAAKTYTITSSSTTIGEPDIQTIRIGGDAKSSEARSGSVNIDGAASFGALGAMMASGGLVTGSGVSENGSASTHYVSGSSRQGSMSMSIGGGGGGSRSGSLQNGSALINGNGYGSLVINGGGRDNERRGSGDSGDSELGRNASGRLLGVDMNTLSLGGMSAEEERRLMQDLNARFAKYIDKIRRVEDPETLIKNEVIARVKKIEDEYENQIQKDRERLKDLEIENVHHREVEEDLTKKLKDRDRKIVDLEDDLRDTKDTLREKIIVIKDLSAKNIENDSINKGNMDREGLVRQVETVVQHVASVTTFAAPPGSGLFGGPGIDETIPGPTDQPDVHASPSPGPSYGPRFGTPLYSKLMLLRAETEALCMNTHRNFTTNIGTLQVWAENQATRALADLQKRNGELSSRVGQLQMDLTVANETSGAVRNAYEGELAKLRQEMSLHLIEYNALYRAKLTLEAEIATYRKLLEEEEERLGFSFIADGDENGGELKIGFGGSGSAQRKSSGMMIQMSSSGYTESSMELHDDSGLGHGSGNFGNGSGHFESRSENFGNGSGHSESRSENFGNGSGHFESRSENFGNGSGHFESRSEHFEIRSGQIDAGDDDEDQQVVVSALVSSDDVRRASEPGDGVMESMESSLDAFSVDAEKELGDILEALSGDEESDRSD